MICISSASRANLDKYIDIMGVADKIQLSISGDDVKVQKPHPDGFYRAAKELGVDLGMCIVVEDTWKNIEAVFGKAITVGVGKRVKGVGDYSINSISEASKLFQGLGVYCE